MALDKLLNVLTRQAAKPTIVHALEQIVQYLICVSHRAQAADTVTEYLERIEGQPWGIYLRTRTRTETAIPEVRGEAVTVITNNIPAAPDTKLAWASLVVRMVPYAVRVLKWCNGAK